MCAIGARRRQAVDERGEKACDAARCRVGCRLTHAQAACSLPARSRSHLERGRGVSVEGNDACCEGGAQLLSAYCCARHGSVSSVGSAAESAETSSARSSKSRAMCASTSGPLPNLEGSRSLLVS